MNLRLIERGTISLRGASQPAGIVSGVATESHQANVIHHATRFDDTRILQSSFDAARRVSRYWAEREMPRGDDRNPHSADADPVTAALRALVPR